MLLFFDSDLSASVLPAPLHAVIVNASFAPNGINYAKPTYGAVQTYVGSSLGLDTFKATTLDSGDVIACYGDQNNFNGITCTHITVLIGGVIRFGSSLIITNGQSIATTYLVTGITVATIGGGVQFMVMFADLLLNLATVTAIGEVRNLLTSIYHLFSLFSRLCPLIIAHLSLLFAIARGFDPRPHLPQFFARPRTRHYSTNEYLRFYGCQQAHPPWIPRRHSVSSYR